jgi:tetratricopeptide (TPR) repeat protein
VAAAVRRQTSPGDSCIDCHMPRYAASDIPHTASTDHSIPRRPAARRGAPALPDFDSARLMNFYRDRYPAGDPQEERSLGLGLLKMMNGGLLRPERHGEQAMRLLESALGDRPGDATLHEGKAELLLMMGRRGEALAEARLALAKQPRNWRLLAGAAGAAQAEGQPNLALDYWRRAVEANPAVPDYQVSLVAALVRVGQVDEARGRCEALLRLDPFNVAARQARVGFLLADGKKDEARSEFEVIRRLNPPDLAQREEWFRRQLQ